MPAPTVLIVEDHASTRQVLSQLFTRRGWETLAVETCADGLAALDTAPDCVILDLVLPDGD